MFRTRLIYFPHANKKRAFNFSKNECLLYSRTINSFRYVSSSFSCIFQWTSVLQGLMLGWYSIWRRLVWNKQAVSSKRWKRPSRPYGVTSHKTIIFSGLDAHLLDMWTYCSEAIQIVRNCMSLSISTLLSPLPSVCYVSRGLCIHILQLLKRN
jgi:hypothetical protein